MSEYLPEINVLPYRDKYRPMYRLNPTDNWCLICKDKKPVECDTAFQARKIALELVEAITDPLHLIEEEAEPLGSIEEWRRQKQAKAIADRERVFGAVGPTRLFVKGREIKVEARKRRAIA